MDSTQPLVYVIGLEQQTARAIHADMPRACIRRRRLLSDSTKRRRRGIKPHLLLLDLNLDSLSSELDAARTAWGQEIVAVGIGRRHPFACVWPGSEEVELVEIGPGFLEP